MLDSEEALSPTTPSASVPLVSTIFGLTYLGLAAGRIPGLRIDRAGIALVGAAAMLGTGVLSMREAARAVDYATIVLLFGMMVLVAHLRLAGFFALATERIAGRFSGPFSLLAVTIALSGVLSAFLVNDVVCVALTPLVLAALPSDSNGRRSLTSSAWPQRQTSDRSPRSPATRKT